MGIIEQATKRLEQLRRGGVEIPWEASGLSEQHFEELLQRHPENVEADTAAVKAPSPGSSLLAAAVQRIEQTGGAARIGGPSIAPPASTAARVDSPAASARRSVSIELDLERLGRQGVLVPSMVRSDLALQFRHIKRPLLRNALGRRGEPPIPRGTLIVVTSSMPGEGKTYCAVNLAMSIAMEVDTSVLLVDADVVRPSVMTRLGLTDRPGLMDVLMDDRIALSDVMLRTNLPKLSLLPAGSSSGMATELLASAAMERLLDDLATRYADRVVILDSPPLLVTTEARVLASRAGQVVMVVDSTHTTQARAAEGFAAVESCAHVMAVLNKSTEPARHGGYGYGYDYQ